MSEHTLGDAPIEAQYIELMNKLGEELYSAQCVSRPPS